MKMIYWWLIKARMDSKYKIIRKFLTIILTILLDRKCSYIGSGAIFKSRPIFPHGISGIFISSQSIVGSGSVIFHQVTIGSNTAPGSVNKGSPTIGDNCYIGAGAKIIGGIRIGDDVRIGANCTVVKDIPSNCVVVNQPSRIIIKEKKISNEYLNINKI